MDRDEVYANERPVMVEGCDTESPTCYQTANFIPISYQNTQLQDVPVESWIFVGESERTTRLCCQCNTVTGLSATEYQVVS